MVTGQVDEEDEDDRQSEDHRRTPHQPHRGG
jgi:hypothetical protein